MVAAKWAKAVVVSLICSGLALGQQYQPHPAMTTDNGKHFMEVPELGAGRKGEVIRSWREPNGKIAYLLKDTSTGELIKILDQDHPVIQAGTNPPSKRRSVFSWNKNSQESVIATTPMPANGTVVPGSERVISSRVISETVTPMTPAAPGEKLTPLPSTGAMPQGQVISEAPPRKGLFSKNKQGTSPYAPVPTPINAYPSITSDQGKVISSTVINEQPMPSQKKSWFGKDKPVTTSAYTPMPASSYPAATMDQGKVISSTVINEQPMPTEKKKWFGKENPVATPAYTPMPASSYPAATTGQGKVISSPMQPEQPMPAQKNGRFGKDQGVPQSAAPAPGSVQDKIISTTVLSETVVPAPGQAPVIITTPTTIARTGMTTTNVSADALKPIAAQATVPQPVIISETPQMERKGLFGRREAPTCPSCSTPSCGCTVVGSTPSCACTVAGSTPSCGCAEAGTVTPVPAPVMVMEPEKSRHGLFGYHKDKEPYTVLPPPAGATMVQTPATKLEPMPVVISQAPAAPVRHSIFPLHRDKSAAPIAQSPATPKPVANPAATAAAQNADATVPVRAAEIKRPTTNAMEQRPVPSTPPVPAAQASVPGSVPGSVGDSSVTKKAGLFSWSRDQASTPAAQATIPAAATASTMGSTPTPAAAWKTETPKSPASPVAKAEAPKAPGDVTQAKATLPGDGKPTAATLPAKVDSAWDYARKTDDGQIKVEKTSMPAYKDVSAAREAPAVRDTNEYRQEKRASAPAPNGRADKVQVPMGAGSVLAASGGKPGAVVYVPVPMMTMPQVTRQPVPPMPPQPQIPQPPKAPILPGSVDEANAFMPKPPPSQVGPDPGQTGAGNAFTVVQGPNSEGQGAFMNRGTGYPAMPPRQPLGYAVAPYGMMPPYGPMPQAVPQTVYVPMPQPGYPAPYGAMPQMQYPRMQYPMAQAAKPQAAPEVVPAGYAAAKEPADEIARQLMRILHDSMYPSERERAVDNLATRDWHSNPGVVDALVKCAQEDPAATVRAACVRGLAKMGVNTVPVANALQSLKVDSDPRVRHEVEQAAPALGLR